MERPCGSRPVAVILGIETSCDETAAAVVTRRRRDPLERRRLADRSCTPATAASSRRSRRAGTSSSSRRSCARRSIEAGATLDDVDRIAVTRGPGLIGALLVGLAAAKALAWGRGLPLVPVDHLHGHVASLYLQPDPLEPPFLCLLASGGHTLLLDVARPRRVPRRRHDARRRRRRGVRQGRAAARPRLPGRGGDRPARPRWATPRPTTFPVARVPGLDFSFSGLKTALLYAVATSIRASSRGAGPTSPPRYQRAIVRALVERAREAAERRRRPDRDRRRRRRELRAPRRRCPTPSLAPLELCTDNAAMIASAARFTEPAADPLSRWMRMRWRSAPRPRRARGVVAAAILVVPARGGRAPPATPTRAGVGRSLERARRRRARPEVGTGQRVLVVLDRLLARRPGAARRWARNRGARSGAGRRGAVGRAAAVHLGRSAARASSIKPEFRFTAHPQRLLGRPRPSCASPLLERTPGVKGVYPVRVAFPASLRRERVREAAASAAAAGRPARGHRRARRDDRAARHRRRRRHAVPPRPRASAASTSLGTAPSAQAQAKPDRPGARSRRTGPRWPACSSAPAGRPG